MVLFLNLCWHLVILLAHCHVKESTLIWLWNWVVTPSCVLDDCLRLCSISLITCDLIEVALVIRLFIDCNARDSSSRLQDSSGRDRIIFRFELIILRKWSLRRNLLLRGRSWLHYIEISILNRWWYSSVILWTILILWRFLCALPREGNSRTVAHLLNVSSNAHLSQLLVFLLLSAVCDYETLFHIQKLVSRHLLLILTFDGAAPTLNLAIAIWTHLSLCRVSELW